mmetsp:Transcript_26213/g.56217  ORF Transcript_26213/g.56217 Transcript_26213/m.56217 type:complete len:86 (-) Transcript_26213:446-703(-)
MTDTPPKEGSDNTMAMFVMAGMVMSSAGFALYTKQADSLLRRMNRASKVQGITKLSTESKTKSKLISKADRQGKAKTFHEKDDFF